MNRGYYYPSRFRLGDLLSFFLLAAMVALLGVLLYSSYQTKTVAVDECPCDFNVTIQSPPVTNVTVDNFPPQQPVDVNVTFPDRIIAQGVTRQGQAMDLIISTFGNLLIEIFDPKSAAGNLLIDPLVPIFQFSAVNGLNHREAMVTTGGGGSVTAPDTTFVLETTSTQAGSFAAMQSRKRVSYRAGQGSRFVFSARFDNTTAASTFQIAGPGTSENGVYFGYRLGEFGILYTHRGKRAVQTLTVTTASSTAENVVVTLNDVVFNVPVTASASIQRTVYEIANFIYTGWLAEPVGAAVVFIRSDAQPAPGVFSLAATTAVGAFAETRAGVPVVQEWIPQSAWNHDKLDGTGKSGVTLHPELFNVYTVSMRQMGVGSIHFSIDGSDGTILERSRSICVHQMVFPNKYTQTAFSNPTFPITVSAYNLAPANCTIEASSLAGFNEGDVKFSGNRYAVENTITTVTNTDTRVLFTIRNARFVNGRANKGVVTILGVSGAVKHTQPVTLLVYRSSEQYTHDLGGSPNFSLYGPSSGLLVDKSATTFAPSATSQLMWAGELPETGSLSRRFDSDFEYLTLQPGESLSFCGTTRAGTAAWTAASIEVREDI